MRRLAALLTALALAACGDVETQQTAAESAPPLETTEPLRGGTLQVGFVPIPERDGDFSLDPARDYTYAAWELYRCCLLRTLMSYSGQPTAEGGAELRPDLAAGSPEVSPDGLAWTFRLKPCLRYAPPYDDREIVAADVVRAVERAVRLGDDTSYSVYYVPLIEGSQAFADGEAGAIAGLETPDEHTLIVHLTEAVGDLGERFALPATAPVPPEAADGQDEGNGAALVASGPYLLEAYTPGEAITLARNPSWDAASDDLRKGYADRIELTIGTDVEEAYRQVEAGALDLVLDKPAPPELAERYQADPVLEDRLLVFPIDVMWYAAMNVAAPPFDDVHVRRAVNFVVDKRRLVELFGGRHAARPARHVAPDSLEGNLLLDYDPYASPGDGGDLEAARAEMAKSGYDRDGDGHCDDPACKAVAAIALSPEPIGRIGTPLVEDLAKVGITLDLEQLDIEPFFARLIERKQHVALATFGWGKDFPNGSGWFSLFEGASPGNVNPFLVGLSPEELERLGYTTSSVPSVDTEIAECTALVGGAQTQCWAELDQLLTEEIVPAAPLVVRWETRILSQRVASATIDQFTNQPALDRIALKPGAG